MAGGAPGLFAERAIVCVSKTSVCPATTGELENRSSDALVSGFHGWLTPTCASAPSSVLASRMTEAFRFWTSERKLTIEPTPMAMHKKKSSNRRHDARISRQAMLRTKFIMNSFGPQNAERLLRHHVPT